MPDLLRAETRSNGQVSARFAKGVGQLDCRRVKGALYPCAGNSKARFKEFLEEKLTSDYHMLCS